MKHLKHLFTALLLLCSTVVAAYDFTAGGIYYRITDATNNTVEVTYSYNYGDYTGSVVIPEYVGNYRVTSIGDNAFRGYTGLTSIEIPNSVTNIGSNAFSGCTGLTSVVIGNSVTSIGYAAFDGCTGLTSITIPNSVTNIGSSAFSGCTGLTSVVIGNSVTSIGYAAFDGCTGLASITIPNSVTSIGEGAFDGCSGLTSIVVDGNNTKYDSRENCNAIIETETNTLILGCKNTIIPNSVTSIGYQAFRACTGLASITIPNSVTSIGEGAFDGCTGLTSVVIGNGVTSIGYRVFEGCDHLYFVVNYSNIPLYDYDYLIDIYLESYDISGISLNKSEVTVEKNESFTLRAELQIPYDLYEDEYLLSEACLFTWSTSNSSVATVKDGVVTAVARGIAIITATAGNYSVSCVVNVGNFNGITSLEQLENNKLYYISQPHHTKGATSWAVDKGGKALKSNVDLGVELSSSDTRQQFAILSIDGGAKRYLYHVGEKKFINKDGSLGEKPVDAVYIRAGAFENTFMFYFNNTHYINVGGSRQMIIDDWSTRDGGNSCAIEPVGEFDRTEVFGQWITGISLDKSAATLVEGESLTLKATVKSVLGSVGDMPVTWSTTDSSVAAVKDGVVTAGAPGVAIITATAVNYSAKCMVTVNEPKTIISLGQLKNNMLYYISQPHHTRGGTSWIVVEGGEALKSNVDLGVELSSSDTRQQFAILSIDGGATRYLYHPGEKKFINKDGSLGEKPVDAVNIEAGAFENTFMFYFDDAHYINVDYYRMLLINKWSTPDGGNSCLLENVGLFDPTEVLGQWVTGISLDKSAATLVEGEVIALKATVKSVSGSIRDIPVTWSTSNSSVVTVKDGLVTAVAAGTATITARFGDYSATCVVTVEKNVIAVAGITLSPTSLRLTEGETKTLVATVTPAYATDKTVTWSTSNSSVATVKDGVVTAVAAGTAIITATAGNYSATCDVTIEKKIIAVTGISLSESKVTLTEGETKTLVATVAPSDATDKTVTWSTSNSSVATVKDGVVSAVAVGTATITAKAGSYSATCVVTVGKKVIAIELSPTSLRLTEGETRTLVATVTPSDAIDKTVTWNTSNSSVATVKDGVVTAVAAGTATITATAGDCSASCNVTVDESLSEQLKNNMLYYISQPHHTQGATSWAVVKGGKVLKSNVDLTIKLSSSDTRQQFAILGIDGGAKRYLYHPGEKKFINKDGSLGEKPVDAVNIKAGAFDNTFMFYFDDTHYINVGSRRQMRIDDWSTPDGGNSCFLEEVGHFDPTEVLGQWVTVTGISLDKSAATLVEGEVLALKATVKSVLGSLSDMPVTWSTSNSSVATVKDGVVTAVAAGTATITATVGDYSATCDVTIEKKIIAVTGISLSESKVTLTEGETMTLVATVTPADATDKTVTWSTTNSAAATVEDGVVTAVAPGRTRITATAGGYSATCVVSVEEKVITVTGITLSETKVTLTEGETMTLIATVTPSNAVNKTVTWSTTNSAAATVEDGVVTAVAPGRSRITATAGGYSATCVVSVEKFNGITSLGKLKNNALYYISQPHHTKGATSWAVDKGGEALKSNVDLGVELSSSDTRQQFAILSIDGGATRYLYHAGEKKFINKDGSLGEKPVDAVNIEAGAFKYTFMFYFDDVHYINVDSHRHMTIDYWSTPDGGNSCTIVPVAEFDPEVALGIITGIEDIEDVDGEIVVYNLQGNRILDVDNLERGIYIVNGKKVFVK